ncbi:MAG: hypothetical protein B6I34_09730 [Anaerolineaceae bacterium 4572_32.1]|nr:MAG: hypothetical protein B6I34_09730 [Anaerolineaceae bacterium 4572_32.1]
MTTQDRLKILKMIEEGQISAAEGAKLLVALNKSDQKTSPASGQPKWLRVRVVDLTSGRNRVNVNIPMSLVNVGFKMGARFAPEVEGVDFEEVQAAIRSGVRGKILDVIDEEDNERVEIFIE